MPDNGAYVKRFLFWLLQWPMFILAMAYALWQEFTWRGGR